LKVLQKQERFCRLVRPTQHYITYLRFNTGTSNTASS